MIVSHSILNTNSTVGKREIEKGEKKKEIDLILICNIKIREIEKVIKENARELLKKISIIQFLMY